MKSGQNGVNNQTQPLTRTELTLGIRTEIKKEALRPLDDIDNIMEIMVLPGSDRE
ncbi:hypothetical protein GCM10011520_05720 [Shewanella carassii]|uniref:Uncharacterized protein n=1 Tax=Shewanella carassii TaxID=1987584 RepID=A0ABQ1SW52_9GAMM|nr:hypothetical protein GCM10011520_05720 [Shewanella carassii]